MSLPFDDEALFLEFTNVDWRTEELYTLDIDTLRRDVHAGMYRSPDNYLLQILISTY